jgi:23S rRNA pseudouridine1911/1915/1917 synthase
MMSPVSNPPKSPESAEGIDVHLDEDGNPRIVERSFVVEERFAGIRLDHYLKLKIPRLSRNKLQAIIKTQLVADHGRRLKPHTPVAEGDVLTIRRPAQPEPPCPRSFEILYRDDDLMVIDKPAGLPVHISAKFYFNTLTRVLSERFPDEPLQICHRLDRETSGCLVIARHRRAASVLKGMFADQRPEKTYLAIVHGEPDWDDDRTIDLPLGLVDPNASLIAIRMEVRDGAPPATTVVRVLERLGDFALVSCRLLTGRQHQIRAHLAAVGHAVVGDKLYAHGDEAFAAYCDGGMTPELLAQFLLERQALHAARIRFPQPFTGEPIAVDSPLPADLKQFLDDRRGAAPGLTPTRS